MSEGTDRRSNFTITDLRGEYSSFDEWYPLIEPLVSAQMEYHDALDAAGNPGKFGPSYDPKAEYREQVSSALHAAVFAARRQCGDGGEEAGSDAVLGFVSCFVFEDAALSYDTGYIEDLHVMEGERGGGVGSALMESAMNWFGRFDNVKNVTLEVWRGNEKRLPFYGRFGFGIRNYDLLADNPAYAEDSAPGLARSSIGHEDNISGMSEQELSSLIDKLNPVYEAAKDETGYPAMPLSAERMGAFDGCVWMEEDGTPVGYLFYTDHRKTFKIGRFAHDRLYSERFPGSSGIYIEQVAVEPYHQNRGIGRELYYALEELFPDTSLYAHVAVSNRQSLRFHGRCGFVPIGDYIDEDDGYHSLLMERIPRR